MSTVDISRAVTIYGWMSDQSLRWLAEQAQQHQVIVEVGVYQGRTTRALADNTPGRVYAVDDWKGSRRVKDEVDAMLTIQGGKTGTGVVRQFKANLEEHLDSKK